LNAPFVLGLSEHKDQFLQGSGQIVLFACNVFLEEVVATQVIYRRYRREVSHLSLGQINDKHTTFSANIVINNYHWNTSPAYKYPDNYQTQVGSAFMVIVFLPPWTEEKS
jgi:hypothetical protein